MKYLQKIERQMKSYLSFYFCEKHGESQEKYLNRANYNYIKKNQKDIDRMIRILKQDTDGRTD